MLKASRSTGAMLLAQERTIADDPTEIDACELFVAKEIELGEIKTPLYHRFTFSHVHFFSLTGFGAFLSEMANDDKLWCRLFTDKSREL